VHPLPPLFPEAEDERERLGVLGERAADRGMMMIILLKILTTRHAAGCGGSGVIQEVQIVLSSPRERECHVSLCGSPAHRRQHQRHQEGRQKRRVFRSPRHPAAFPGTFREENSLYLARERRDALYDAKEVTPAPFPPAVFPFALLRPCWSFPLPGMDVQSLALARPDLKAER